MKIIKRIVLLMMMILSAIQELSGWHIPDFLFWPLLTVSVIIILLLENWYCELTGKCVPWIKKIFIKKPAKSNNKESDNVR